MFSTTLISGYETQFDLVCFNHSFGEGAWNGLIHVNLVLNGHVPQLSTYDADIKSELDSIHAKLDEQKAMLETVLANQETIIELLKAPSGKRDGWNQ